MRAFNRAVLCASLIAVGGAAHGQTKPTPAPPPPVGAEPSATAATFGDWTLRCQKVAGEKAARVCEAVQTVQVQGQAAPIAQIAFGRPPGADALKLVVVLPVNVSFPGGVRMGLGDKAFGDKDLEDKALGSLDLPWRRCVPGGCFAETAAPDEAVKRWRAETGPGRVTFKDAAARDVAVPISFRGLAQALDALTKP